MARRMPAQTVENDHMKILAACTLLTLGGCALVPNSVRPEFEHISHATQHEPFTNHPTEYGANMANLVLHWDLPRHFSLELAEGVDLDKTLETTERQLITRALELAGGNRSKAAQLLGISFRSLRYRLVKLGMVQEENP